MPRSGESVWFVCLACGATVRTRHASAKWHYRSRKPLKVCGYLKRLDPQPDIRQGRTDEPGERPTEGKLCP